MGTSIVLEIFSDDPQLRQQIEEVKALGEHSLEYMEVLAALHQWEANRLLAAANRIRGRQEAFDRKRKTK